MKKLVLFALAIVLVLTSTMGAFAQGTNSKYASDANSSATVDADDSYNNQIEYSNFDGDYVDYGSNNDEDFFDYEDYEKYTAEDKNSYEGFEDENVDYSKYDDDNYGLDNEEYSKDENNYDGFEEGYVDYSQYADDDYEEYYDVPYSEYSKYHYNEGPEFEEYYDVPSLNIQNITMLKALKQKKNLYALTVVGLSMMKA